MLSSVQLNKKIDTTLIFLGDAFVRIKQTRFVQ